MPTPKPPGSLRKVVDSYTGSALNVRRSSDDTTMDIGFDGSGNLDTVALNSFVGSGNGYVVTWYDQAEREPVPPMPI